MGRSGWNVSACSACWPLPVLKTVRSGEGIWSFRVQFEALSLRPENAKIGHCRGGRGIIPVRRFRRAAGSRHVAPSGKLGRQLDALDEDLAIVGETLSPFIRFWLTITPPLPDSARESARAKGAERFEGFMQSLGRRLATGDRFLKELSRDITLSEQIATDFEENDRE